MRKWMTAALSLLLFCSIVAPMSKARAFETSPNETKIFVNGKYVQQWRYEKDRILIPLVQLNTSTGGVKEIVPEWNAETKTVTLYTSDKKKVVKLKADQLQAEVNGQSVALDVPVRMIDGRTYVPLRFVSEALNGDVQWNPKTHATYVRTPERVKKDQTMRTGELDAARKEVLSLPWYFPNKELAVQSEGFSKIITFPEGEALRYYILYRDVKSYIEVDAGGVAVVKWQGRFNYQTNKYAEEQGAKPAVDERSVFFRHAFPVADIVNYGRMDIKGVSSDLGSFTVKKNSFSDADAITAIPNEPRIDGK
jgi:hypothetical protein